MCFTGKIFHNRVGGESEIICFDLGRSSASPKKLKVQFLLKLVGTFIIMSNFSSLKLRQVARGGGRGNQESLGPCEGSPPYTLAPPTV